MTQTELTAKITEIEEELLRLRKMSSDATSSIGALREKLKDPTNWTMNDTEESINADITRTQSTQTEIEKQIKAGEEILEQYKAMTPTNEVTTAIAKNTMTEEEKVRNAALAAQHPERVVDGVYYASDEALQKAKEAYDKRIAEETKQANAEAIAKANNLAAAMKRINETLYGTDNAEVISQLQGSVGGAELSSILGNATTIRARQHLLNFKTFKNDFKEPNSGKPPQNRDPFPVDQKIEEFETHLPRVKIYTLDTHNHGLQAAKAVVSQCDAIEKRLVRIENNISTFSRYLFRMGARVMINCHYYGGQTTFENEGLTM